MSTAAPPREQRPQMDARMRARRRAVVAAGERRRRRLLASLLVLLGLLAGGAVLSSSSLFAVAEVRVSGVSGGQAEAVRTVAAVEPGQPLLAVDLAAVAAEVEALAWVREVAVSRVPPSTVDVAVVPREPVVNVGVARAWWLVDADGVVVAGGLRSDLPRIEALASVLPPPGEEVADAAVRNALAAHLRLPEGVRERVDRYEAPSARGLLLHLADEDVLVRLGLAERVELKAEVLGLLLEQAREQAALADREGLGIAEIDVRAPDNPVLVPAAPGAEAGAADPALG